MGIQGSLYSGREVNIFFLPTVEDLSSSSLGLC